MDDALYDKIFNIGFGGVAVMITIGIIVFAVIFINVIVSSIKNYKKNNKSPRLTVTAKVISKRADITSYGHMHTADNDSLGYHSDITTWYYVAFQVDSGDRMEFCIPENEYGLLIEGDTGKLTFQGTRYISFDRF